ncbi:MAG: hypothetical protein IKU55_02180, partial [Clostridia bacterium]|nr:hypothetical protein [Clostridia bacterium]
YVAAAGPAVLGSLLVEETAGTVSQMVSESQNGLYGFARYANQAGVDAAWRLEKIDALNIEYVERIFGRDATYDVEVIGLGNNLSFAAYYVCAVLLLMVLLMGTICVNLLTKSDLAINRLLTFRRFGAIGQTVGDYLPFFAIIALNLLLFFVGTGIAVSAFGVKISFLSMLDGFGSYLRMGLMMLPAVMLLTAMQFFLYELTTGVVSAVLLQILSAIALSFASGYLLPLDSLPPVLASASAFLPTGVAFSYVGALFTDSSLVLLLSITVGYSVVLLAAAAAVRNVKIRGSRL